MINKNNLGVLSIYGTVLLLVLCGISAYLLQHYPLVWQITGGLAVVSFIATIVLNLQVLKETFSKRTTRYGLNAVLSSFVVLAIVVVINMIANEHDIKKDFTKNKLHTLSEQSVKVVKGLKSPVVLKAFVGPQQLLEFENLFSKYTYHSDKLKREFVDVDKDPMAAQRYGVKSLGTIVVESENRTARVDNLPSIDDPKVEEKLTNAIIQVAKGDKKKAYFLSGHGEKLLTDTGRDGYSDMKESMENSRYRTEELVLIDKDRVPADAEILIIAGPKSDILEHEYKMLEQYLRRGGKVLLMMEPNSTPSLKPFLAKYGADWNPKKTVIETNKLQQMAGGNPLSPIITSYDRGHEITADAKQISIFVIPTPVERAATPPNGNKVTSLFQTTTRSFEAVLEGDKVKADEKTGRKGPLSLAVAISGKAEAPKGDPELVKPEKDEKGKDKKAAAEEKPKDSEFRLVVVGDTDFASNGVRRVGINADLFQNMLSWLSKEEDLIAIRPRPTDSSEFEITEERARIINLASIVFAPLGLLVSGFAIWFSRRRR